MALELNTRMSDGAGGTFMPIIKYYADSGRFFRVDRGADANGKFESNETELRQGTSFVFDFGTIEIGWALLAKGMPPSWAMAPHGFRKPPQPTPEHREGFRLHVWNPNLGVREFASTAKTCLGAVDELHTIYEHAPEAAQGLLPVVRFVGVLPIAIDTGRGKKTTYRPVLEITRWVERGVEFGVRTVAVPGARPTPTASVVPINSADTQRALQEAQNQTNPRHVGPPVSAPAAQATDDWGNPVPPMAAASANRDTTIDDEIPF